MTSLRRKKVLCWTETAQKSSAQEETLCFHLPRSASASCTGSPSQRSLCLMGKSTPNKYLPLTCVSLPLVNQPPLGTQSQWQDSWFLSLHQKCCCHWMSSCFMCFLRNRGIESSAKFPPQTCKRQSCPSTQDLRFGLIYDKNSFLFISCWAAAEIPWPKGRK